MAWIVMDLDNCLVEDGEQGTMPTDGALEAVQTLMGEGHRLTIYTSRFAPMPDSERDRLKQHIAEELLAVGFPPLEVWTGTTKPAADIFLGDNHITYDGDWGMALAQCQQMLEDRGLIPPPGMEGMDGDPGAEPGEEPQPAPEEVTDEPKYERT